jgi:predicted DNA-binding transcriptional regulator AlpA
MRREMPVLKPWHILKRELEDLALGAGGSAPHMRPYMRCDGEKDDAGDDKEYAKNSSDVLLAPTPKKKARAKKKKARAKKSPAAKGSTDVGVYLTTVEAAKYLKLSRQFLEAARYRADGTGPPYIKLERAVRYRRSELDAWMTAHDHSPDKPV